MQIESTLKLTVQVFANDRWQDAMDLEFLEPSSGFMGPCRFGYALGSAPD
ncbi:hypothetical protein C4J88_5398 [Pseudomonas sp. R4-39-08]|nr:hypothetical protein C4J88_5398 [Pseudomonas sp. R4-39-08]